MPKDNRIWDNCKEIGTVMKSNSTRLLVQLTARDGVKYINIREQYKRKRDDSWQFGRGGFAIPVAVPINEESTKAADNLMAVVHEAIAAAQEFAIADPDNAVYKS